MQISCQNLIITLQRTTILHSIDLQINGPQLVGLIGANGSGKSTLLKSLTGLIPPKQGSIIMQSRPLHQLLPQQRARHITLLAPQEELQPDLSVDLLLQTHAASGSRQQLATYIEQLALASLLTLSFKHLSQGEQAKVLLARTLLLNTPIVLLDEPFAHLDLPHEVQLWKLLQQEALTRIIIIASHHLALCAHYSQQLLVLKKGQLIAQGYPQEILNTSLLNNAWDTHGYHIQYPPQQPPQIWFNA